MSDRRVEIGTVAARWPDRGQPDPAWIARLTELALRRLVDDDGSGDADAERGGAREPGDAASRLAQRLASEIHRRLGGDL